MTIIYFILILGITVFIHELGHFIFAKKAGIYVYEFALGMGPRIFKFNRKDDETTYSIRLFPIGGFVQLAGEEVLDDEEVPANKKMSNKKWHERFLTISAGIVFNFILAIVLFFVIALVNGAPELKPVLVGTKEGTSAYQTDLKKGDTIIKVNGVSVYSIDDFLLELATVKNDQITILVDHSDERANSTYTLTLTDGSYGLMLDTEVSKGLIPAIKYAFLKTGAVLHQMIMVISYLFIGKISLDSLAGPIGIFSIVDDAAKMGILNLMYINAIISVNVGFVNLLPIPAFDGGRLLFLIIEKIIGKPVNQKFENIIHTIGFALLMLLMIIVTYNDIIRLFK